MPLFIVKKDGISFAMEARTFKELQQSVDKTFTREYEATDNSMFALEYLRRSAGSVQVMTILCETTFEALVAMGTAAGVGKKTKGTDGIEVTAISIKKNDFKLKHHLEDTDSKMEDDVRGVALADQTSGEMNDVWKNLNELSSRVDVRSISPKKSRVNDKLSNQRHQILQTDVSAISADAADVVEKSSFGSAWSEMQNVEKRVDIRTLSPTRQREGRKEPERDKNDDDDDGLNDAWRELKDLSDRVDVSEFSPKKRSVSRNEDINDGVPTSAPATKKAVNHRSGRKATGPQKDHGTDPVSSNSSTPSPSIESSFQKSRTVLVAEKETLRLLNVQVRFIGEDEGAAAAGSRRRGEGAATTMSEPKRFQVPFDPRLPPVSTRQELFALVAEMTAPSLQHRVNSRPGSSYLLSFKLPSGVCVDIDDDHDIKMLILALKQDAAGTLLEVVILDNESCLRDAPTNNSGILKGHSSNNSRSMMMNSGNNASSLSITSPSRIQKKKDVVRASVEIGSRATHSSSKMGIHTRPSALD